MLKGNLRKIPDLSAVSQIIVDKLKADILDWIPAESMVIYDVLNPFSRPSGTYPFDGYQFRETHLISLYATMFPEEGINLDDSDSSSDEDLFSDNDPSYNQELKSDWRKMLTSLTNDKDWCKMLASKDLLTLWQHYLGTRLVPERMKKLICKVLAVPIGSADVERAFSILSHIRNQRRSQLTAYHIDTMLWICLNGPKVGEFLPLKYSKSWVQKNRLLTDDPNYIKKTRTKG